MINYDKTSSNWLVFLSYFYYCWSTQYVMTPHLLCFFKPAPTQFTPYAFVAHNHDWFGQIMLKTGITRDCSKYEITCIFTQVTVNNCYFWITVYLLKGNVPCMALNSSSVNWNWHHTVHHANRDGSGAWERGVALEWSVLCISLWRLHGPISLSPGKWYWNEQDPINMRGRWRTDPKPMISSPYV